MFDEKMMKDVLDFNLTESEYYALRAELLLGAIMNVVFGSRQHVQALREKGETSFAFSKIHEDEFGGCRVEYTPMGKVFHNKLLEYNARKDGLFELGYRNDKILTIVVVLKQ
jgi:hypothetical protein